MRPISLKFVSFKGFWVLNIPRYFYFTRNSDGGQYDKNSTSRKFLKFYELNF